VFTAVMTADAAAVAAQVWGAQGSRVAGSGWGIKCSELRVQGL